MVLGCKWIRESSPLPPRRHPTPTVLVGLCAVLLAVSLTAQPLSGGPIQTNSRPVEILVRFRPQLTLAQQASALMPFGAAARRIRKGAPRVAKGAQAAPQAASSSVFDDLVVVALPRGTDGAKILRQLRNHPAVVYAEPNYPVHIAEQAPSPAVPNDFYFDQQWGLQNPGVNNATAGADIHAAEAWAISSGSRQTVVAVIDTGIDSFHPDLAGNIWRNEAEIQGNGIDDDGNGYVDDSHGYDLVSDDSDPMDDNGHGTHVAGIIGAVGNNRVGISGVCWQVSLMPVKVFDENGEADVAKVVEGIAYAIDNGARIINASWEQPEKSQALADAVAEAHRAGLVVIAAAGNESSSSPAYPAAFEQVMGVAATDANDQRAHFSNFGANAALAAPGVANFSTLPNNSFGSAFTVEESTEGVAALG